MACTCSLAAPHPSRPPPPASPRLLRAALAAHADRIVVGLGGSATTDGGRGAWTALTPDERALLGKVDLVAATDVDNPLLGSTAPPPSTARRRAPPPSS